MQTQRWLQSPSFSVNMAVRAATRAVVTGLPEWHTDHSCRCSHRPKEPAAKCGAESGMDRYGCTAPAMQGSKWMNRQTSQLDGLQLSQAEVLKDFMHFLNSYGPKLHSIDYLRGKRRGERKWPTFLPPRSRTICVQPTSSGAVLQKLRRPLRDIPMCHCITVPLPLRLCPTVPLSHRIPSRLCSLLSKKLCPSLFRRGCSIIGVPWWSCLLFCKLVGCRLERKISIVYTCVQRWNTDSMWQRPP